MISQKHEPAHTTFSASETADDGAAGSLEGSVLTQGLGRSVGPQGLGCLGPIDAK